MDSKTSSISQTINSFLQSVSLARSEKTARTYQSGLSVLKIVLRAHQIDPDMIAITDINEDIISWMISYLRNHSPSTERLYLTALSRFYEFIVAENLAPINLSRVKMLIRQRARRPGQRLPQFPKDAIEVMLEYAENLVVVIVENETDRLRNLRDRAFLIVLADTGLRVHEACKLKRGDILWHEGQAIIIGKGNRQAVIRFSSRSQTAIRDYINARAPLDGNSGHPLGSLPLFSRHDKGSGKKILPITPTTGRNIVASRVAQCLGVGAVGTITPHSFRHYFVTRVLNATGNLKLAQVLARHQNIAVTQRYAHLSDRELDEGYRVVFEN